MRPEELGAYYESILDKEMRKEGDRARVLAQALYYCQKRYFDGKRVPPYIVLIDKDEFVTYRLHNSNGL